MKLKPYDMVKGVLTCSACSKKANVLLLVGKQGTIKVHEYLCCDDFSVMSLEIPNGDTEQSGDSS
jgi:hypothetical protein